MEILKFQSHKWGHPSKSHSSQFINLFEIYIYIPKLLILQLASRLSHEIQLNFPLDLVESIPFVIQFFATHVTFVAEFCLQFIYSRLTWLLDGWCGFYNLENTSRMFKLCVAPGRKLANPFNHYMRIQCRRWLICARTVVKFFLFSFDSTSRKGVKGRKYVHCRWIGGIVPKLVLQMFLF